MSTKEVETPTQITDDTKTTGINDDLTNLKTSQDHKTPPARDRKEEDSSAP